MLKRRYADERAQTPVPGDAAVAERTDMMATGLLAFALATGFCGAAFYIGLVEQPARLSLDDRAMLEEWTPSDRRGVGLLGLVALASAIAGFSAFATGGDLRWLIGAFLMILTWPYMYFLLVPINNRILAWPKADASPALRLFLQQWGLVEWGLVIIGLAGAGVWGWALGQP